MKARSDRYLPHNPEVRLVHVTALKAHKHNARTHSPKQIQQIANNIKQFGFTNPVLIDATNRIMAGHGRVEAAKKLGIESVPTICINYLTAEEIRAYILADNKIAANAGWDYEILAPELQYLSSVMDLDITGFETPEIDLIIGASAEDSARENEAPPAPDPGAMPITWPGDVWKLGPHLLVCGNALEEKTYRRLMGDDKASMIFSDPPFNVPVDGHVSGLGKTKHREFAMASGEMTSPEFLQFLKTACTQMAAFSADGSLHYLCMDWRHIAELIAASRDIYTELKNICVWNKNNAGMGSLYRSKHELVAVFKKGTMPHTNNIELGRHGRYRTNVWDYPGANALHKGVRKSLRCIRR